MAINWSPGCGCCDECTVTDVRDVDWTGWTNPPASGNVITAGNTTTYTHALAGNDFTVDIEVANVNDSFGSVFRAGRQGAVIVDDSSVTKIGIDIHDCQYTTISADFWVRIQEATISAQRRVTIEVWDGDPELIASSIVDSFCHNGEPDSPDVGEVTIELTAGDTNVTMGVVRVSATAESTSGCPAIACVDPPECNEVGGAPTHIITAIRCVVSGLGTETITINMEWFEPFCGITTYREQTLEVDLSIFNGTYNYELRLGSTPLTTAQQNEVLDAIAEGRCTPSAIENYRWWAPEIDVKQGAGDIIEPVFLTTDVGDCTGTTFFTPPIDEYPSGNPNDAIWKPLDSVPRLKGTSAASIVLNRPIVFQHDGGLALVSSDSYSMYQCAELSAVSATYSHAASVNDTSTYVSAGYTITYDRSARSQSSVLEVDYVYR